MIVDLFIMYTNIFIHKQCVNINIYIYIALLDKYIHICAYIYIYTYRCVYPKPWPQEFFTTGFGWHSIPIQSQVDELKFAELSR